jgi:hypothetical protein
MTQVWQGWRRPRTTRGHARAPWEPLEGATGSSWQAYTQLMDAELLGGVEAYEYCVLPEGQRPHPGADTYRTRVMRAAW